jgi:hypothetical protein
MKLTFTPFLKRPFTLIPSVLLAVAVLGFAAFAWNQHTQAAVDDREIKDAVTIAFNPSVSFGRIDHIAGASRQTPPENLGVALGKNDVDAAREQARLTLTSISSAKCVVCSQVAKGVDDGITGEANGVYRIIAGGMRDVNWRQITVSGDTASVTVAATTWIKTISRNEFGKVNIDTPTEGGVKIFTLARENGHWVITNMVVDQLATNDLPANKGSNAPAAVGYSIPGKPASNDAAAPHVKDPSVQQ